ncbi:putative CheR methyltransferase, SAM binding domain protein, partial [Treponema vincentii ATCC 35580]
MGFQKTLFKPPHPIFGDINIKYIYGVVENAGQLYILLDVDRIFAARTVTDAKPVVVEEEAVPAAADTVTKAVVSDVTQSNDALDIRFIGDTLAALGQFYASPVNNAWLEKRYYEWRDMRVASSIQIQSEDQAREFLSNFLSPDTRRFWSDSYMNTVLAALPDNDAKIITVWNVGCDAGYETYSLAVLLKQKYPRSAIRIYANDADLLAISNAPMLTVPEDQVINRFKPYLVKGVNDSYSFK